MLNCVYTPVKLYSSTEDVCPGGTVVFTCVTDTGKLIWSVGNGISQSFHSPAHLNVPIRDDIFTLLLQNVTGDNNNTYHSTVTATNVSLAYNEMIVLCSDAKSKAPTRKSTILALGTHIYVLKVCIVYIN